MQSGGYSPKAMGSGCWAHDRERKATGPFHPKFRQRADAATGQGTVGDPLFLAARLFVRLCDDANATQAWVGLRSLPEGLDFLLWNLLI